MTEKEMSKKFIPPKALLCSSQKRAQNPKQEKYIASSPH